MSGGPKPSFLMPTYDAQELRRRMVVAFTIGELYRFAEKLQVPQTDAWANSPQDAARDIIRHFERSGAMAFLVEALQEAKPLVEWPAPNPPAAPMVPAAPPSNAGGPASVGAVAATVLGTPAASAFDDGPTAVDLPGDRPTPIGEVSAEAVFASMGSERPPGQAAPMGFAPAMMPRPGEAVPAAPVSAPGRTAAAGAGPVSAPGRIAAAGPVSAPGKGVPESARGTDVDSALAAFAATTSGVAPAQAGGERGPLSGQAGWPGTVRAAAAEKKALDYRILIGAGAAVLVGAVAIAFFAGRASSSSGSGSGAASGSGEAAGDQVAIARHAAAAVGASLARVAKSCQVDVSTLRGRPLFAVVYSRCGPMVAEPGAARQPSLEPDPVLTPPDSGPEPGSKKGQSAGGGNRLQKVDTKPAGGTGGPGSGCLSRCSSAHGSCTARCGAEPKQGSQYDAYQSCLGGCLKALSQCKMGCQ